jgi:hypothetical protein
MSLPAAPVAPALTYSQIAFREAFLENLKEAKLAKCHVNPRVKLGRKPAQGVTEPAQGVTKPAQGVTKPAQGVTKPAQAKTKKKKGRYFAEQRLFSSPESSPHGQLVEKPKAPRLPVRKLNF